MLHSNLCKHGNQYKKKKNKKNWRWRCDRFLERPIILKGCANEKKRDADVGKILFNFNCLLLKRRWESVKYRGSYHTPHCNVGRSKNNRSRKSHRCRYPYHLISSIPGRISTASRCSWRRSMQPPPPLWSSVVFSFKKGFSSKTIFQFFFSP